MTGFFFGPLPPEQNGPTTAFRLNPQPKDWELLDQRLLGQMDVAEIPSWPTFSTASAARFGAEQENEEIKPATRINSGGYSNPSCSNFPEGILGQTQRSEYGSEKHPNDLPRVAGGPRNAGDATEWYGWLWFAQPDWRNYSFEMEKWHQ
jgi:hypothetical protein